MPLLLVVLSILCTAHAQGLPGCDSDLINILATKQSISLQQLYPKVFMAALASSYVIEIDSATFALGEVKNNTSSANVTQCNEGKVITNYRIEFKQASPQKLEGDGYPANSKSDFYYVDCTNGLILGYICDPANTDISGDYAFTIKTKTNAPVAVEALEACKAVVQQIYNGVTFTSLTVGACENV